jgi:hypothetical protein
VPGELGVALEAIDRADLGKQLGRGDGRAAGQLEQRRRDFSGALLELLVELRDLSVEGATARDELACQSHLHLLLAACEPTADPLQVRRAAQHPQRHDEGGVERVQVPTQPLLHPATRVDEIVAMVNQQLQITKDLLIEPWAAQLRLPQRRSRDRQSVDRIGLAPRAARPSFRHRQLRRHPHQLLTRRQQLPLQPTRQLPTVLDRPQPPVAERGRPGEQLIAADQRDLLAQRPAGLVDRDSRHRLLVYVQSDHDHSDRLLTVGGDRRADRPQSRRKPRSYQVTLDGLGRRRRHNAGRSALGRHSESSQPPPPESAPITGRHHPARMTLSSGMTPDATGAKSVNPWLARLRCAEPVP